MVTGFHHFAHLYPSFRSNNFVDKHGMWFPRHSHEDVRTKEWFTSQQVIRIFNKCAFIHQWTGQRGQNRKYHKVGHLIVGGVLSHKCFNERPLKFHGEAGGQIENLDYKIFNLYSPEVTTTSLDWWFGLMSSYKDQW